MSKNEQLVRLVEALVKRELKTMVPQAVREVLSELIMEGVGTGRSTIPDNSSKRRQIQETVRPEMEEYPTMGGKTFDRASMAELLGYGDMAPPGRVALPEAAAGKQLIVSSAVTEAGTVVPVDPNSLPDHVVHALTRDYRDVMSNLNKRKNGG